jgi:hypothetical protein
MMKADEAIYSSAQKYLFRDIKPYNRLLELRKSFRESMWMNFIELCYLCDIMTFE